MKTKAWIAVIAGLLAVCLGLSFFLLRPQTASVCVQITSQGAPVQRIDLRSNRIYTIELPDGNYNELTVQDGKIAVTAATCPDHYCMQRGYCDSGTPIVCLPNQLVISFLGDEAAVDGAVG